MDDAAITRLNLELLQIHSEPKANIPFIGAGGRVQNLKRAKTPLGAESPWVLVHQRVWV
jgi:hypothetical protein